MLKELNIPFNSRLVVFTGANEETGVSCHGALPEGSVNAGYLLAKKLCDENLLCKEDAEQMKFIECLLEEYYGGAFGIDGEDKVFGKLTCSNGIIRTESGKPALTFDIRYGVDTDYENIKNKISEFFGQNGWSVRIISEKHPYVISEDNVYLQKCLKAYKEFCKTEYAPTYINAGATYAGALPCAIETGTDLYGGKPESMPEGHGGAHQPDECINEIGFLRATELILHMVLECDAEHSN